MTRGTWVLCLLAAVGLGLTMIDLHGGPAPPPPAGAAVPDPPVLAGARQMHAPPRPGEVRQLSIKQLGNFKYEGEKQPRIPPDVMQLDGMKVELSGYMIPLDQASQVTRFSLVPSIWTCCYGQPPEVQHVITVECPAGKSVPYIADPVVVRGKLSVGEVKEEGYVVSLFRVACDSVRTAGQK